MPGMVWMSGRFDVTPSDWTNVIECWTGSPARDGQKGSCHEKAEVVQFRIQASSC
jgi:hypothetical protein